MAKQSLNRKKSNPNQLVYTGKIHQNKVNLQLISYSSDSFWEDEKLVLKTFEGFTEDGLCHWLNVTGLHDVAKISKICSKLNVHNLAVQDILDVNQRPKFQEYEQYWFFSLKSVYVAPSETLEQEQISFVMGNNYLVSFHEKKSSYPKHIQERLRNKVGIIRDRGPDYLLYLLLEAILDNYFKKVDEMELNIDAASIVDINADPSPEVINMIERQRRDIFQIKKTISSIKEIISGIEREKFGFVKENHEKYFYELRDLCIMLLDACEIIQVKLESQTNMFFSVQGHRMNQVMKTLTIVATIFIPLTFVAGIYGMNFNYMPELHYRWGYAGVLGLMFLMLVGMVFYFRRRGWF